MNPIIEIKEHFDAEKEIKGLSLDKPKKLSFLNKNCLEIEQKGDEKFQIKASYFIGIDWITSEQAIYIAPKLNHNQGVIEIDYLKMLFSDIQNLDNQYLKNLFIIKFDEPLIPITQKQDLITPLLLMQFLNIVKNIVRKGLKKSYYKIEENLTSKVKGKIVMSQHIKQNVAKVKPLHHYCNYQQFGYNNLENRLLKKTLIFITRYLNNHKLPNSEQYFQEIFNFVNPAFLKVSDQIQLNDIKHSKLNPFFKEYDEAIRLARIILQRFGYNISNVDKQLIATPPFWIDMSKLFELYVLGLLKKRFPKHNEVQYHFGTYGNELDFLLNTDTYKMVVDAKYKPKYLGSLIHEDMRQVSGYARLKKVYNTLQITDNQIISCLIIYPNQTEGLGDLDNIDLKSEKINEYIEMYKLAIKLPTLSTNNST